MAKWLGCDMAIRICSDCREEFDNKKQEVINKWKFCPVCGASMNGKLKTEENKHERV